MVEDIPNILTVHTNLDLTLPQNRIPSKLKGTHEKIRWDWTLEQREKAEVAYKPKDWEDFVLAVGLSTLHSAAWLTGRL
jgi:hypothetical protein